MEEPKKYYYLHEGTQEGPLTYTEIRLSNIKTDTLVWFQGMAEWMPAEKVGELRSLFPYIPLTSDYVGKHPDNEGLTSKITPKQDKSLSIKVYKSSGYKDGKVALMFFFIFLSAMGIAMLAAVTPDFPMSFGLVTIGIGVVFLLIYILVASNAKEMYNIGTDYSKGILWVVRSGKGKKYTENWAYRMQKFQMVQTSNSRFIAGRGMGGVPRRVVEKKWELQVLLEGSPHFWPVPNSVFCSKKDARAVMNQVNAIL